VIKVGQFAKSALYCALAVWIIGPLVVVLSISFISPSIAAANKAQIWMMTSALFAWCIFSALVLGLCQRFRLFTRPAPNNSLARWALFVGLATLLALCEEVCTQFMTEHATLFGVPLGQAYITPSLDYWDTVIHHSVIVFVPMFASCAVLTEKWKFSPREIFFLIGITGLTAEVTMNPASLFMGFWLLIYGFMVLAPALWLYRGMTIAKREWWHYVVTIAIMLAAGAIASLALHATFPQHPDNHFVQTTVKYRD
jgi:hypothetical protein